MLTLKTLLIICPLVFLAGFVDAIAGGGGLISLPAYLLAGLPPHQAIATNKMSSTIGTCASTARYLKNGYVDWQAAIPCMVMAILGANFGARLILLIPQQYIQYLLLGTLPVIAFVVLKRKPIQSGEQPESTMPRSRQLILAAVFSLIIGLYDGLYGPGTGTFLLMLYTGLCKMSLERASCKAGQSLLQYHQLCAVPHHGAGAGHAGTHLRWVLPAGACYRLRDDDEKRQQDRAAGHHYGAGAAVY